MADNTLQNDMQPGVMRKVRSFVRREGRWTDAQRQAYQQLSELYSFDPELNWQQAFVNNNSFNVLEIGFGMGHSLAQMALAAPDYNFLGVEVHRPGVSALFAELEQNTIKNVRVYADDVVPLLQNKIPRQSIHKVQIFFPDPWPKRRHHKRRLVQQEFLDLLYKSLAENCIIHIATDWQDYATHVQDVFAQDKRFQLLDETLAAEYIAARPKTKFELRGLRLGHKITDLVYKLIS